ncbi:carboxylesterase [Ectothiorhodospiraceae bacterium BW-2]|nr:carboxylesterase [Ectothiorhodospiraceae bacterium BW-2]
MSGGALLPAIVVEPAVTATATIIWLHGLGADGHDFEPIVPQLGLEDLAVRFIFPHAPARPVTVNGGMVMPAWYDIYDFDLTAQQDREGIVASAEALTAWIETQIEQGIAPERIILAGFSQGGAVVLHTALHYGRRLGGVVALSTYLPLQQQFTAAAMASDPLPLLMAHGEYDPVIPAQVGRDSYQLLSERGYAIDWYSYPMAHSVSTEELQDMAAWLRQRLTG